jgi:hypothetical protein
VRTGINILENELVAQYPDVLEILLRDHTTQKKLFWATNISESNTTLMLTSYQS